MTLEIGSFRVATSPITFNVAMAEKPKTFDFEKRLKELEKLVNQLETGEMSLEESLKAYEQGIELTRQCQSALDEAQRRIQIVIENDEKIASEPLDPDTE